MKLIITMMTLVVLTSGLLLYKTDSNFGGAVKEPVSIEPVDCPVCTRCLIKMPDLPADSVKPESVDTQIIQVKPDIKTDINTKPVDIKTVNINSLILRNLLKIKK